jgi:uroporphyrin-III C-methyltransferase
MSMPPARGRVALVGAGPGDPDLLTVAALRWLQQADVVLYDNLVSDAVLALCPAEARRVDVGKRPHGAATTPQEDIHTRMAREALAGHTVVRLKGGDPFVFGRGGEEVLALRALGIEAHVVPGISSAFAGPLVAGIPVTHRGLSRSVTVVTGYSAEGERDDLVRHWYHLGQAGGTLVVLMGLTRLDEVVATLQQAGWADDTPACAIHAATTPRQQVVTAPLHELARQVRDAGFTHHTLLVFGPVVALREALDEVVRTHAAPTLSLH